MTGAGTGQKIQGVAESAIVQQVGQPTYWTAEQAAARENIKVAFESHEKVQWEIGDLLNVIAPSKGHGVNDAENSARVAQVAAENGLSVRTLLTYRQVAAAFPAGPERDAFRTWQDAKDALTAKAEKDEVAKGTSDQTVAKVAEFAGSLKGKELDEHQRVELRIAANDIAVALGDVDDNTVALTRKGERDGAKAPGVDTMELISRFDVYLVQVWDTLKVAEITPGVRIVALDAAKDFAAFAKYLEEVGAE